MTTSLQLALDARGARTGAASYARSGAQVVRSSAGMKAAVDGVDRSMVQLKKSSGGAVGGILKLVAGMAAFASVTAGTRAIAQFETSIVTLGGVSNATAEQLTLLEERAKTLGATTRFSASEAADGLIFLARAGFDVERQLATVGDTLNLAATSGLALGEAADFASNIMAQFALQANEMERVVDSLTNTSNNANTDVRQLAEAMKFAGPVAGALGRSLEETSAALGVLGDRGLQASLAGTNVRGILSTLLGPTDQARRAIDDLGLSMSQLDPTMNSIVDIFETLKASNLSAAQAIQIFQKRNAGAAIILTNSTQRMRELIDIQDEYRGSTERLARLQEDTLAGSFLSFKSAVEGSFIALGDAGLRGAMRSILDEATGVLRVFLGMEDTLKENKDRAILLANAAMSVAAGFAAIKAIQLGAALATTAKSMVLLTAAMLANPFTLVAVAIGGATAALVYFREEMVEINGVTAEVRDFVTGAWDEIRDRGTVIFEALVAVAKASFRALLNGAQASLDAFGRIFGGVFDTILDSGALSFDSLTGLVKNHVNRQIGFFKLLTLPFRLNMERIVNIATIVWDEVSDIFRKAAEFVGKAWQKAVGFIADKFQSLLSVAGVVGKALGMQVKSIVDEISNTSLQIQLEASGPNADFLTKLAAELDPVQYAKDLQAGFDDAVNTDHIQKLMDDWANVVVDGATNTREALAAIFEQEGIDPDKFAAAWDLSTLLDEVTERADVKNKAREFAEEFPLAFQSMALGPAIGGALGAALEQGMRVARDTQATLLATQIGLDLASQVLTGFKMGIEDGMAKAMQQVQRAILEAERLQQATAEEQAQGSGSSTGFQVEETARAAQAFDDMFARVELEKQLLGKSREERDRYLGRMEAEHHARIALSAQIPELIQQYGSLAAALAMVEVGTSEAGAAYEASLAELQKGQAVEAVAAGISNSIGGALESAVLQVQSLGDALRSLAFELAGGLFNSLVTKPLTDTLTGALTEGLGGLNLFARGGVLAGGGARHGSTFRAARGWVLDSFGAPSVAHQTARAARGAVLALEASAGWGDHRGTQHAVRGRVLSGPTRFPLASGEEVVGGEAGFEGLLPLKHMRSGNLGVEFEGTPDTGFRQVNQTFHVTTPNPDSFRASQRQLMAQARRGVRRLSR